MESSPLEGSKARGELRRATPADAAFVEGLSELVFRPLGGYASILGGWFAHPAVNTLIFTFNERSVGFVMWAIFSTDDLGFEGPEADIVALALEEESRGQGLGGFLLDAAVVQLEQGCRAVSPRVRRVGLSVALDNHTAQLLYTSRGFKRRPKDDSRYPSGHRSLRFTRPLGDA